MTDSPVSDPLAGDRSHSGPLGLHVDAFARQLQTACPLFGAFSRIALGQAHRHG
jgi:hypothetical protein